MPPAADENSTDPNTQDRGRRKAEPFTENAGSVTRPRARRTAAAGP